jgi:Flp pilus assembly protein TadG
MQSTFQRHRERGTTIVEAALVLPVFFAFLFGVMEAGRFLNVRQVLTNAAREGARFAVAPLSGSNTLPTTDEIEAVVNRYLASASIETATVNVDDTVTAVTGPVTTRFTQVTVASGYEPLTGLFPMLAVTLTAEAVMRNETSN